MILLISVWASSAPERQSKKAAFSIHHLNSSIHLILLVRTTAFLFLMPKTLATAFIFSICLGMTGDATVSPTSGLVSDNFHLSQVATLVGILFFCHQIGAFLSAYLGGALLEATGGYQAIWLIDVALCAFASIMSYLIRNFR